MQSQLVFIVGTRGLARARSLALWLGDLSSFGIVDQLRRWGGARLRSTHDPNPKLLWHIVPYHQWDMVYMPNENDGLIFRILGFVYTAFFGCCLGTPLELVTQHGNSPWVYFYGKIDFNFQIKLDFTILENQKQVRTQGRLKTKRIWIITRRYGSVVWWWFSAIFHSLIFSYSTHPPSQASVLF